VTRRLLALLAALLLAPAAGAQPIDRRALVDRHAPVLTRIDRHAPLMVGNGELGFTADITGLQTFPDAYAPLAPLLTMAQWSWHSFPNPRGYAEADGLTPVDVPGRGTQPYPWMRSWADAETRPAFTWLRENPHRFSMGRVAMALRHRDGTQARVEELGAVRQRLDLWTGTLHSRFTFDGQPVAVETRVHPTRDVVLVTIRSPLVAGGRLGVDVRYPGVSAKLNPDPSDWGHPGAHRTTVVARAPGSWLLRRMIDATTYWSGITAPGATIAQAGPHAFRVSAPAHEALTVAVGFEQARPAPLDPVAGAVAAEARWRAYWSHGGVIDFTGSTDPRAPELERRIILSQYLSAVNGAGSLPPQEEGLFSNSWNGKFHLEMHAWHSGHFALWGRPALLERSLGWYARHLPAAKAEATRHRVSGAWWPKMAGPEGRGSPSTINPFIMWHQPHPIYLAEIAWRAHPDAATLARYGEVVEQTARLLATFPRRVGGRLVLGPPIIPVQENHPSLTTTDPLFELEYFRWGLRTAQAWRLRRGLPREPLFDQVVADLSPPPVADGLYLPVAGDGGFWRTAASPLCRGHAIDARCLNRDHPSFLMAYGLIGGDRIDPETMRRTLRATERDWDLRQTWGWDFPMIAMTAARLGEPEQAVAWLLRDLPNNQWGTSGMTPRVHLEEHAADLVPGAPATADGSGAQYRRGAETYFPSNGALLLATGMMAAGWDGSHGPAPGFPRRGWRVRVEGIRPLP
jgi:hypothetical protein